MKKHLFIKFTVLLLTLIVGIGQMEARTFSGGEIIYIKNDGKYDNDGAYDYSIARLILRTTSESNTGATLVTMTNVTGNTDYYKVVMPAGNWNYMLVVRTNATKWSDCSWGGGSDAVWNNTWQLNIDGTANMFQGFKAGTNNGGWHWMIPKGATFYFDKTEIDEVGEWGSSIYLRIGRNNHAAQYDMAGDPVTGTTKLYKYTMTDNYVDYSKFIISNNYGYTGDNQDIVNIGGGKGNVAYISHQLEYVLSTTLTGLDYTFIGYKNNRYKGDGDQCTYYKSGNYNYKKTWTITCTSVDHATVELYYYDPSNTKQIVTEGNSAQVLPTTKVWCKVTPDDGYSLSHVNLYDPTEREWTDASREDGSFERNCYVVRTDVRFEAVIEPYATKTILVKDINSWAPDHMYVKGWNPFLYEGYTEANYHYTTQKVTDKITLCSDDYYVITISNEFPFYYIHNENDASRTAFFATTRLTHMAKYDDYTSGTGDWGLRTADCGDAIYWVETYKGTGPKYISNIVSNVADTMSFYVEQGGTVEYHAGGSSPVDQYSTVFAKYFASKAQLDGKAGGVFTATSNAGGTGLANDTIYDGDYHIHVNAKTRNYLNAGGVSKPGTTGTKFIRFDKSSLFGDTFDHYWVDWFLGSADAGGYNEQSVVATVGNKYNSNLAGVLGADAFAPKGKTQSTGGNVRYGYDPETNNFERAIVASGDAAVQIQSNTAVTDNDSVMVSNDGGSTYTLNAIDARYFADATNWNYQVFAKVRGGSHATAKTAYVSGTQILANQKQLIGGEGSKQYVVVITYDFKTNRFIAAWLPEGDFDGFDLESNLMVVRTEDGNPTVLNIVDKNSDGNVSLTKITKIYTVLELLQDNWNSDAATYSDNPYAKRRVISGDYIDEYYWISLPYECLVKDIFGIEDYGSNGSWVLQTYRGDLRAEKGWWAETNAWWYDMDRSDTLKAHEGYVLRVTNLNEDYHGSSGISKKFKGDSGGKLFLYFPSEDNELTIAPLTGTVQTHLDSLKCTKWHKRPKAIDETEGENNPIYDRRAVDSNWRIIGSPSFNSTTISAPEFILTSADKNEDGYITYAEYQEFVTEYIEDHDGATPYSLKYFYNWEVVYEYGRYETKFTIANAATTEFKGTHAHLVQYAGDITWVEYNAENPLVGITNKVTARHQEDETGEQTLRLVLKQGERDADIAYISRMAFGATMGYDLNMDLSKMINANSANIYTMGELYKMAGNCIPDTVTTLQVGVQLAADGAYTFAIPEGTYGTGIILVDNETGTRTNLALTDYTVNLTAGTYDERFELELSPIADVPSDIETLSEDVQGTNVRKVMVDGVLYIVKDGVVYDARGNRVQ